MPPPDDFSDILEALWGQSEAPDVEREEVYPSYGPAAPTRFPNISPEQFNDDSFEELLADDESHSVEVPTTFKFINGRVVMVTEENVPELTNEELVEAFGYAGAMLTSPSPNSATYRMLRSELLRRLPPEPPPPTWQERLMGEEEPK